MLQRTSVGGGVCFIFMGTEGSLMKCIPLTVGKEKLPEGGDSSGGV